METFRDAEDEEFGYQECTVEISIDVPITEDMIPVYEGLAKNCINSRQTVHNFPKEQYES